MSRRLALVVLTTGTAALLPAAIGGGVGEATHTAVARVCVSETGTGGGCQDGTALENPLGVATSTDGKSVYVASDVSDAIAVFDRDPATGALTQKAGAAGCVSETGTGGSCRDGRALNAPNALGVSADGKSVYVASIGSDAIAIFDRNSATGALTQKPGRAGCISETGTAGACRDGKGLDGALDIVVSADGRSVYVASQLSDGVAVFNRDPATGALWQKTGAAGCISEAGRPCQEGKALDGALSVAVSPDGRNVYVVSTNADAVAILDRDPATGALSQRAGTTACISQTGTDGVCREGKALDSAAGVAVSADGRSVYVASQLSDAVSSFDRHPATGVLTQKVGAAGCVSETGAGRCQDGAALDGAIGVAVSPEGNAVYATSTGSDALVIFDRDQATGELALRRAAGWALDFPRDVAPSADGKNVYVVSAASNAVAIFDARRR